MTEAYRYHVTANFLGQKILQLLRKVPSADAPARSPDFAAENLSDPTGADYLRHLQIHGGDAALQAHDGANALLSGEGGELARDARVLGQRPLHVDILARRDARPGRRVVVVDARVAHHKLDFRVRREVARVTVRARLGGQVEVLDGAAGCLGGRVEQRDDLVLPPPARREEIGEVAYAGPGCGGGGGEADEGNGDG